MMCMRTAMPVGEKEGDAWLYLLVFRNGKGGGGGDGGREIDWSFCSFVRLHLNKGR